MKSILVAVLLFLTVVNGRDIPTFNVDIDASPREKWAEIAKVKAEAMRNGLERFVEGFPIDRKSGFYSLLARKIINQNLFPELQNELHVISDLFNIDYPTVLLANLVYEFDAFGCTSFVARDSANKLWFGRNLDWSIMDYLAEMLVRINWTRNGNVEFITEHFAGMPGTSTGIKPGQFALSLNERDASGSFIGNVQHILDPNYESPLITVFKVLKNAANYDEAVTMLSTTKIMAPCYFQIAGVKEYEGAILARDYDGTVDKYTLADDKNSWFIVQTNSDRGVECPRRKKTIESLTALGPDHVNSDSLIDDVLAIFPTKNEGTVFSVAYCPATGERKMSVWY